MYCSKHIVSMHIRIHSTVRVYANHNRCNCCIYCVGNIIQSLANILLLHPLHLLHPLCIGKIIQSFANILLFHPLQLLHPLCRIQLFANIFLLHPLQLLHLLRRQDNTVTCKYVTLHEKTKHNIALESILRYRPK